MNVATNDPRPKACQLLSRPVPGAVCLLAWCLATVLFIGLIAAVGGPTGNDATESAYSTWAIEHGRFSCSYPPITPITHRFLPDLIPGPHVAPLWPLVSGALAAATGVGHGVSFPSITAFGPGCSTAYLAMYHWAGPAVPVLHTLDLGYISWFFLLAGVITLLRAAGRGRKGWEILGVLVVSLVPIMWAPLLNYFHPQDLMTIGLLLGGLGCVIRRRWILAGVLLGLAATSQQFALLVLIPMVVITPGPSRWKLITASVSTAALVTLPLVVVTSGQAWDAITIGTGNTKAYGGTVLWELHLHGTGLVLLSRVLPVALSAGVAWFVYRRLGSASLEPVPVVALAALCLSLRLVFEQNLYGYYFAAIAVFLIVLDCVVGRLRGSTVAFLACLTIAFNPIPYDLAYNARSWGHQAQAALPAAVLVVALLSVVWGLLNRRIWWFAVLSAGLALFAFGYWPPWSTDTLHGPIPIWLLQVGFLVWGIALVVAPLLERLREDSTTKGYWRKVDSVATFLALGSK